MKTNHHSKAGQWALCQPFCNEEAWYADREEIVAQHLFPIMYASGLFMDEPEMADIDEDADLSDRMCANIPAAVVELYLMMHGAARSIRATSGQSRSALQRFGD